MQATLHRFTLEPQGPEDYETYNWRTATHPQSRFTNNLVASRVVDEHVGLGGQRQQLGFAGR